MTGFTAKCITNVVSNNRTNNNYRNKRQKRQFTLSGKKPGT